MLNVLRDWWSSLWSWLQPGDRAPRVTAIGDDWRVPELALRQLNEVPLRIEAGLELLPLVDPSQGGKVIDTLGRMRASIAEDLGWVFPGAQFSDNPRLPPLGYRIFIWGHAVAEGQVMPGMVGIAPDRLTPEQRQVAKVGERPKTGELVAWVPQTVEEARRMGLAADEMMLEHLEHVLRQQMYRFVTPESLSMTLETRLRHYGRELADELLSRFITRGELLFCFRELLRAGRSLREFPQVIEALYRHCHSRSHEAATSSDAMFGMALQIPQFSPRELAEATCREMGWPSLDERMRPLPG
ncbi:MAG: FHIPEP family type III secretion protein [bacterium]|nr:FHIPEP family type III secretion protein [bacterium]